MSKEHGIDGRDRRERRGVDREDKLFEREDRKVRAHARDAGSEKLFWREEPRGKAKPHGRAAREDLELFHEFGRGRPRGWGEGKPPSWL